MSEIDRDNYQKEKEKQNLPKNVFIFAASPPTSGKTTQTIFLSETTKARIIRGRDVAPDLAFSLESSRELVPDDIFVPALKAILENEVSSSVILDNIPRTRFQAEMILDWSRNNNVNIHLVQLVLSEDEVVKRVGGRRVCPNCGESYHPDLKPAKTEDVCDKDGFALIKRKGDSSSLVKKGFKDHKALEEEINAVLANNSVNYQVSASGNVYQTAKRIFTKLSPAIFYKPEMAQKYYELREILDSKNFRHLFFSGMPVFMYGGRALMKDFDILVSNSEIGKVAAMLNLQLGEKDSSVAYTKFVDIGPGVEINSNLVVKTENQRIRFDFDFLWEEAKMTRFMGLEIPMMGLEDLILFKAALGRVGTDDWGKHKDDITDIEGLIGTQSVNWTKLKKRAARLNMIDRLVEKLKLINIDLPKFI